MRLLQTIASGGMKDWTPGEWGVFFGAVGAFVVGTIIPFLGWIFSKIKEAKTLATSAKTESSANTDRIISLAQNMPSPGQPPAPVGGSPHESFTME